MLLPKKKNINYNDFIIFYLYEKKEFYLLINKNIGNQKIEFLTFDKKEKIIFQNNYIEKISLNNLFYYPSNLKSNSSSIELDFENYIRIIKKCIQKIKNNLLQKIVITRIKKIKYSKIDIIKSLQEFSIKFPKSFIYFFLKKNKIWIGATPELLGKLNHNKFETMSLAGTVLKNESFSLKEIIEQQIVTNFIVSILRKYTNNIKIKQSQDYMFNNIKHILTIFNLKINPLKFNKLINELHPTPAICGFPREIALKLIQKMEPHFREYYTGTIKINLLNTKLFFVNLRCVKLFQNHFEIFIGGGITEFSNPNNEWEETELKLKNILSSLKYN